MNEETYILTLPKSAHPASVFSLIEEFDEINEVDPHFEAPLLNIYALNLPESIGLDTVEHINDLDFVLSLERSRGIAENPRFIYDTENLEVQPNFDHESFIFSEFVQPDIAIIDSGIDQRNNNLNEVKERHNYTVDDKWDATGHGTAIALMYQDSLPNASFYDMKVITREMLSETSVIGALNDALAEDVDFINLSIGFPTRYKPELCPLCHAVNQVVDEGIPIFASAGNKATERNPMAEPLCPACAESAVAMGSKDEKGNKKPYSAMADIYGRDDWLLKDPGREDMDPSEQND